MKNRPTSRQSQTTRTCHTLPKWPACFRFTSLSFITSHSVSITPLNLELLSQMHSYHPEGGKGAQCPFSECFSLLLSSRNCLVRSPSQLRFHHFGPSSFIEASLVAQMIKNLLAIQETQFWSMGWEDVLERGMATHSSVLAWRILQTEEPGGLQSTELQSQSQPND